MRGKTRTIPILLLLATAILSQSLITPSAGLEYPAIYIDPATIGPNGYGINTQFNISIRTDYIGTDIWGWKVSLTYNPLVLEGVEVFNGDLTINATHPAVFNTTGFDNYAGKLGSTEGYFKVVSPIQVNVTNGPGILAKVTFKVVGLGDSDIKLGGDTRLTGYSGVDFYDIIRADLMPDHIGHSYFCNVSPAPTHDIAVTSVEPNVTKVLAPASVSINVTVKNNGTANERFAVKVYYEMIHPDYLIGSVNVDNMTAGTSRSDIFTWDTTYVEQGNHTIIAKAGPVARETDTVNNKNEEAWVNVYSPYIAVVPEKEINPDLGVGSTYWVSIYTDYNATEVVGSNDVSSYEFTLTWNSSVLQGSGVANGGGMPQTDMWVGDNSTTIYTTTKTPVMYGTETVTVNGTNMKKDTDYTIVYSTGAITFTTAPDWVMIEVEYWYSMDLMTGATFTNGSFVDGQLTLTSASVATPVSGPGVLATVNFTVVGIGESDIVLGTKLKRPDTSSITMPHRLKKGRFNNRGDAAMVKAWMAKSVMEMYETWTVDINVEVQNVWGAPDFDVKVYYTIGATDYTIGTQSVIGLGKDQKTTKVFNWNPSGMNAGAYIISAEVIVATGDHDPLNDYASDGTVKIRPLGDITGEGKRTVSDMLVLKVALTKIMLGIKSETELLAENPFYDITGEGRITVSDMLVLKVTLTKIMLGLIPGP